MSRKRVLAALVVTVLLGGGLFATWYFARLRTTVPASRLPGPDPLYSNVLPDDYVGPQTCGQCHEQQYRLWSKHPHRFMNQLPTPASIKGNFDDHVWTVRPNHTVTFSRKGDDYLVTIDRPTQRTRYKVTRTVGSRFVQFYIGVQLEGAEPAGDRVYTNEHKLPFGYWFRLKRWLPADYFDVGDYGAESTTDDFPVVDGVDAPNPYLQYNETCLHCHNTYPHAYRVFKRSLAGFPDADIEGDYKRISAALSDRIAVEPSGDDFVDLPYRLEPDRHLVTLGISCESCHHGGREHARLSKQIAFFPVHPHVHVLPKNPDKPLTGKRDNPATSQGICAQCHIAGKVSTYPNGARVRNSSEVRDLLAGACTTQITCVTCHDPHTPGAPSGGPTPKDHLDTCVSCHPQYTTAKQQEAHSRHSAASGVDCMDCHMPRISQGIDVMMRTHRISRPVERSMISEGDPNACNLCHLDKSVGWTLGELKRGWGAEVSAAPQTPNEYLEQPAGKVYLGSKRPITRMAGVDAYARSPLWKSNLAEVLKGLHDENPTCRCFAIFSVERMLGRRLQAQEYEVVAGPKKLREQAMAIQALFEKK